MNIDLEGVMFLSVYTVQFADKILIFRDRYTVLDGKVCEIKCGKATPTGDRIEEMLSLQKIGYFDPSAEYEELECKSLPLDRFIRKTCG